MNSKDFLQALRKVIREEVQVAVRTELTQFSSVITETKKQPTTTVSNYTESIKPIAKQPVKKTLSKNSVLNDLLNETRGFSSEGPAVYMEEQIDYNDFSEWPTMNSRPTPTVSVLTDVNGSKINAAELAQTEAGAAVVNALTKDYSALMKAIDKKKGK
jgi:hypothetical protein